MKKKMMAVLLALTLTAGTMSPLGVSAEEQPEVSTEHVEIQELGAGVYTGTCGEGAEYIHWMKMVRLPLQEMVR